MKVKFWGVRGSIPTPWIEAMGVGGNTSCVQVITDGEHLLILDSGTGIRLLGNELIAQKQHTNRIGHILLSHTHWDHIQGFPFFTPAFIPGNQFNIYGAGKAEERLEDVLKGQMSYQYFPVELESMGAIINFVELQEETIHIEGKIAVTTMAFNHPGGVYGFRIEYQNQVVVYATDMEYTVETLDPRLVAFAKGADVFIFDSQYTIDELKTKTGWGHSTPDVAAYIAREAGVKRLMLFHHEPLHSDQKLTEMEAHAREIFAESYLAREGEELDLSLLLAVLSEGSTAPP